MKPQHAVCVVVCTRDRFDLLHSALGALARQTDQGFETLVVNQGLEVPPDAFDGHCGERMRLINDTGRGLSRARNLAWRETRAEWVAFIDDDCLLAPDWVATLKRTAGERFDCCLIVGGVIPVHTPAGAYLPTGVLRVRGARARRGRWQRPLSVGQGVCAVRRETIAHLDGWDERLGAGSQWFPAAEDEDFIYRMLREGGAAYQTPALRAWHVQWRTRSELVPLFRDYMIGRGGTAAKHASSGDLAGGMWLLTLALLDCAVLIASAARFPSRFRLRVGWSSLGGLLVGLRRGLRVTW